ncbi:glycoside hydrolase domain-containing protein [Granulicella cerasi]|uniref:Glycoside hydrolase domain-containing protein n=1 Tax=Granulicella cerasi TaxID=741063 RepID=A0ABW1Z6B8_9BACT
MHHIPYLFAYARKPWLTQKWARKILDQAYADRIDGICGNDDVGQMSAWYVMSALGFYPVCPGSNVYIIGSPLFEEATVKLDPAWHKGRTFQVRTLGNAATTPYVRAIKLNGKALNRCWITHEEIVAGGVLELTMDSKPALQFASAELPPATMPR